MKPMKMRHCYCTLKKTRTLAEKIQYNKKAVQIMADLLSKIEKVRLSGCIRDSIEFRPTGRISSAVFQTFSFVPAGIFYSQHQKYKMKKLPAALY
jgi:hypothetical protein